MSAFQEFFKDFQLNHTLKELYVQSLERIKS